MTTYIVRRVLFAIVTFFATTFVAFVMFHVIPTGFQEPNDPLVVRYGHFWWNLVAHGSLGATSQPPSRGTARTRAYVNDIVFRAAPITASVVAGGVIVWLLISIPLGTLAALRPRSLLDRGTTVFVLFGICAHPVWFALTLSYFVSYKLGLTPIQGYCEVIAPPVGARCGGVGDWAYHLVLPWFCFAFLFSALYARMTRYGVIEAMAEDHVRTARAKGAGEIRVVTSHVLRNALLPIVTMLATDVPIAFGGAIFTEIVFSLPGLGMTAWQALQNENYIVLQGIVIFTSVCVIVVNLFLDLVYVALDPRIRVH